MLLIIPGLVNVVPVAKLMPPVAEAYQFNVPTPDALNVVVVLG